MRGSRTSQIWPAVAAALLAAACATSPTPAPQPTPQERQRADSIAELEALYQARLDSAKMRFTPADVRFITGMIAHHAQAIVMSRLVPERTNTSSIRTLAARIINSQQDEIERMQRWLRDRGQPVPEIHIDGLNLMVHGAGEHAMHAAGMLTQQQLEQLAAARGEAFDRLFLTSMIQHHKGATAMVRELFATDGAGQDEDVFRLATDVNVDQITEINRMEAMLKAMSGTGGQR